MVDICVPADLTVCLIKQCDEEQGDRKNPTCVKKFFLPMTSIVDAEGYDTYNKLLLAYFLGPFYTLCCWDTSSLTKRYEKVMVVSETNKIVETGNDKIKF